MTASTRTPSRSRRAMDDEDRVALVALGMRVRLARVARRETQQDVADRAGVSRSALSCIEQGTHLPSLLSVWRLADALAVPVAELIDREQP